MTHTPHGTTKTLWKEATGCRAVSKRSGERCKRPARANGVCYIHGGNSPAGLAHPSTKHSRYSKHLPTRLVAQFAESLSDPDLLNLRSEIALVDSSIADLISRHEDPMGFVNALMPLLDQRRKLADSERARLKDMSQMITAEQALLLISTVYQAVANHVHDSATLAAIGRDLQLTLTDGSTT